MNRGGSRPGSGRKKIATDKKRVVLSCRVAPQTMEKIKALCQQQDVKVGVLLDEIIGEGGL